MLSSPLPIVDAPPSERRRHSRVRIAVLGRYMLSSRQEFPCQTIDMSPGGLAVIAPVRGALRERVICYIDQIGRVEGSIARLFENGFALALNVPLTKREKLADQLTWLGNRNALGMPEDRRHARVAPRNTRSVLTLLGGKQMPVRLLDVSISGAAFSCDALLSIGMPVTLGGTPAQVVRMFGDGAAVEFSRPFSSDDDPVQLQL